MNTKRGKGDGLVWVAVWVLRGREEERNSVGEINKGFEGGEIGSNEQEWKDCEGGKGD